MPRKTSFKKLEDWLQRRGWRAEYPARGKDFANFDDRLITVSRRSTPEHQLFAYMHECGHVASSSDREIVRYCFAPAYDKFTNEHKISKLIMEMRAWDAGEKIAQRLGIRYRKKRYAQFRARMLKTYMRWLFPKAPCTRLVNI